MFNKNFKRRVFSLVIVAILFTSTVSFGSGFGSNFGTYKFVIPIFNNIQWRQIPIFRFFEPKEEVEEKPEESVEETETPEEPVQDADEVEEVEEVDEPEVPEKIDRPEKPSRPSRPEKPKEEKPVEEKPEEKPVEDKPVEEKPEEEKEERPVENQVPNGVSNEEQEVLRLVNIERQKAGLSPFTLNSKLSNVARDKSKDMAHNNYFSHQSPTHGSPFDMMKAYGISYRTAGENIAKGYNSAASVVNGWMNSPGHRANILNSSFNTLGVGYYNYNGTAYWTQMFTN